jgi:GTP-binding protein
MATFTREKIRNIAIIAHVDHGKTTLVDALLGQSGTFRENQEVTERLMDSNDLEKERGITILAKCTAIYRNDFKINIVDTPGHADFGGEVERILGMVDGVVLLVDAAEGPMPQTKFVLSKALKLGINPIVVINKIDRADEQHNVVLDKVFDLFVSLNANDKQLEFPYLFASGRNGWSVNSMNDLDQHKQPKGEKNLNTLYDIITSHVPMPSINEDETGFAMLGTILHKDQFFGRTLTGKVFSGVGKVNSMVKGLNLKGEKIEEFRLTKLFTHLGVQKIPTDEVIAGDIVTVAGMETTTVSDSICDVNVANPVKSTPIDPPTMAITISVNTSPLAGTEGTKVTSRMIRDRLFAEAETNVAITVKESGDGGDSFEVGGRGELGLGVLAETMRREGFEIAISRPKVIFKMEDNKKLEPIEEVVIDVDDEYASSVIAAVNLRKGEMVEMVSNNGRTRLIFNVPSRGLIGYQGKFLTETRGSGILNRIFKEYAPFKGDINTLRNGSLISNDTGESVAYAIDKLQDRGKFFVGANEKVYVGMIVGENSQENDLEINILKTKQLTNVRSSGTDDAIKLTPPLKMTLEAMMAYIQDDELVEVTPKSLRLRKKYLNATDRKKFGNK